MITLDCLLEIRLKSGVTKRMAFVSLEKAVEYLYDKLDDYKIETFSLTRCCIEINNSDVE